MSSQCSLCFWVISSCQGREPEHKGVDNTFTEDSKVLVVTADRTTSRMALTLVRSMETRKVESIYFSFSFTCACVHMRTRVGEHECENVGWEHSDSKLVLTAQWWKQLASKSWQLHAV